MDNSTIKYIEDEDAPHDCSFRDWMNMRLLVSPMNLVEAQAALDGGADIIDVKNPKEGSLGANFPWTIRAVADLARRGKVPVSYTHLRAHETVLDLVCRLLLAKKKINKIKNKTHNNV